PGGGASHARAGGAGACGTSTRRQETLSSQQLRKRAVRWGSPAGGAWGATTGGTCESTPAGSAAGRRRGSGGGQQQQQRPPETLSPQQLREWVVQWGSPGGEGFRGTRTGGVEAPDGVEAASLGAFDSASAGAEPEEALHTFTLDSSASCCFFRDSTTVTPLTAPVPVILADPSGGPVVARGAIVLPCLVAPSGLLLGLHLPSFAKNLVDTPVTETVPSPHFLRLFAVRYAAHKLNLWPSVSVPETSPTLRWTGEVGDVLEFRVWGSLSLVRDLPAGKLSPRTPPLPPPGPAPSGVSQVDPPPLVETLEVSSDTCGPAEGGDPTAADTVAPRRSARLAVPPGFPSRPSSPPLQPVTVDSGAARGGDTGGAASGGAGSEGAECPMGTGGAGGAATGGTAVGGAGGAGAGGTGARRQESLLPERLREWAVLWGSPGGSAGRAGRGGTGRTIPGVGRAGGTGTGGTRGTGAVGAIAGGTGSRQQEPLLPERLREWAVRWGSPGDGAGRTGAGGVGGTGFGGASAGVHGVGGAGGADTRGANTGGGDTGGATGGTGVGGAIPVVELEPQKSALIHLLSLPPAATEFPVAGTTPPLQFPLPDRSQLQLLPHSPLPAPAPYTAVIESLTEIREPASRPVMPVHTRCVCVVLPSPPASSLPHVPGPDSDLVRTASPTVTRLLATVVSDPSFESAAASALVAELVDFSALCRLDYAASLIAMDAEMASWKSTGTYVDAVPPPSANITFSPTPKMTTLRVLLHVAKQRDYELHSLDVLTAFLQGSLQEAIWLRRPRGFTVSFPEGTQWSLRRQIYSLRQVPHERHDTLRTTLAALGFAPSTADPSRFLRTDTSLSPFYVLVYVEDLVFATTDTEALALVKAEVQEKHICTDLGELRSYLGLQITRDRARRTIT
ncbi:unnamed protein product, partial [Closterium sp. NIES-54]